MPAYLLLSKRRGCRGSSSEWSLPSSSSSKVCSSPTSLDSGPCGESRLVGCPSHDLEVGVSRDMSVLCGVRGGGEHAKVNDGGCCELEEGEIPRDSNGRRLARLSRNTKQLLSATLACPLTDSWGKVRGPRTLDKSEELSRLVGVGGWWLVTSAKARPHALPISLLHLPAQRHWWRGSSSSSGVSDGPVLAAGFLHFESVYWIL